MKNFNLFVAATLLSSISIFSCQQDKPKTAVKVAPKLVCYQSVSEKDTAWLTIDTAKKVITGTLTFRYITKKQTYEGQFKGEMYRDTLRGHYDFKINKAVRWNRNPVAFLKKDGKLTMGIGQFMLIMGSAHFDQRFPINYEQGRFTFEEVSCRE